MAKEIFVTKQKPSLFKKHFILFFLYASLTLLLWGFGYSFIVNRREAYQQKMLEPFYVVTDNLSDNKLGDIIRYEQLSVTVSNGKGYRILYVSELSNGKKVATSGMLFVPTQESSERKIVAWAHGTIGMGATCAPSRQKNPLLPIPWVSDMLDKGYVVTATDYYGLGTSGTERYLIGKDEGLDVLNSVRAARMFPNAQTSNSFSLFGLSQGGHSVLFAGTMAKEYSPELNLVSVVAAAPAAELPALIDQQYNKGASWIIGPEISVSYPIHDPSLKISEIVTQPGLNNYKRIAQNCVNTEVNEVVIRENLGEQFFKVNPNTVSSWKKAFLSQTPSPLASEIPLLVVQSLSDEVVLPNTTALLNRKFCDEGSNVSMMWISNVDHQNTAKVTSPNVVEWITQRFSGVPVQSTCNKLSPVAPYEN